LRSLPKQPKQSIREALSVSELKNSSSYSPSGWLQATVYDISTTCSGVEYGIEFIALGVCVSSTDGTNSLSQTAFDVGSLILVTFYSYPTNAVCSGTPVVYKAHLPKTCHGGEGSTMYKYINGSAVPHAPYTNSLSDR
jgi:hypothetical protein